MQTAPDALGLPDLGRRIAYARERVGLNQEQLAEKLGIRDRQTIQAIEAGQRRVAIEEMIRLISITGQPLDFFTDPFRLVGEGSFTFRASESDESALEQFQERAGRWIALWTHFAAKGKKTLNPLRFRLAIDKRSSFEEAQLAGEALGKLWKLGDVPAENLAAAAEEELVMLILYTDMPEGISGAACQLQAGDAILINRQEYDGRRNFDLAHEIFHVLTWQALPPPRVDQTEPRGYKDKRIEQLAENFASALLMPSMIVQHHWEARPKNTDIHDWLKAAARHFRVTAKALKWRLFCLDLLKKSDLNDIDDERLVLSTANRTGRCKAPAAFSRRFIEKMGWAVDRGDLSVRRLASLLEVTVGELTELFTAHGLTPPFEL
jgi:Zn-dependent peptidase ImmA (M78 family)/transcriptional regulator with XRE-family HTH domain